MTQRHIALLFCAAFLAGGCAAPQPAGKVERLTPEQLAALKPAPNPNIPLAEVVALSRAAMPADAIIGKLRDTGTFYNLTPQQIVGLRADGVDQKVIDHLVDAQERARQATLVTEIADRDAQQAQNLARERARRQALQDRYSWGFGYGPWGPSYGFGWNRGYYYDSFFRAWRPRW